MTSRTKLYQQDSQLLALLQHSLKQQSGCTVILCAELQQAKHWHQLLDKLHPLLVEAKKPPSLWEAFYALLHHQPRVLIGTKRLALLPLTEADQVIIIDPEDPAHQQWDQHPRYHVLTVAEQQGPVVCFSQAPLFKQIATHALDTSVLQSALLPDITVLHPSALLDVLRRHDQIVLWHNRTGVARYALCQSCQTVSYDIQVKQCAHCGSVEFRLGGFGTAALIQRLRVAFPDRSVVEITSKTTSIQPAAGTIWVGTSAIFSRIPWTAVTAAVATSLDGQLAYPDYRSHETTLQQLIRLRNAVQTLYISTYAPQHPVVQAVQQPYPAAWYQTAMLERQRFGFPL